MAGPARGSTGTAAGATWSRRWKPRANSQRTGTGRGLARGVHGTALAGTQRPGRTSAGHLRTRTLKNWLAGHRTSGRGTHGPGGRAGLRRRRNWPGRRSLIHRTRSGLRHNHSRRGRLRWSRNCGRRGRTRGHGNGRLRRRRCCDRRRWRRDCSRRRRHRARWHCRNGRDRRGLSRGWRHGSSRLRCRMSHYLRPDCWRRC